MEVVLYKILSRSLTELLNTSYVTEQEKLDQLQYNNYVEQETQSTYIFYLHYTRASN